MPHDKHGNLIEKGDEVLIRARVREIWPDATTCQTGVRLMFMLGSDEDRPLTPREQRWADGVLAVVAALAYTAVLGWLL